MSKETSAVTEGRELHLGVEIALFAVAAAATIGLGYWLLSQGSITAAPILLVIGYVVLVPLAILR